MRSPLLRLNASPLAGLLLFSVAAACVRGKDGADTAAISRRTPVPTIPPTTGKTPPTFKACEDTQNTFTNVDTWTLRYNSQWAANVIVTLVDPNNPNSLVFTHPTKDLADKRVISEDNCIPLVTENTTIDTSYPIIGGVNLFSKTPNLACPGSKAQVTDDYRYVFVMKEKKYIAVSKGADGCSAQKQSVPGNCYLWGEVNGNRVTTINNACIAGYNIYDKAGGIVSKKLCGTDSAVQIQGQPYPAGFILIHEPFPGWQKQTHNCQNPGTPLPPKEPTPTQPQAPQPTLTPAPLPTTWATPGIPPSPGKMPPGTQQLPTPAAQATPVIAPPKPTCDVWRKGDCYDGWTKGHLPSPTVPPQQQQQQQQQQMPTDSGRSIWYKK
ncbi:MAG: hypothetical protein IOD12_16285 [Silvanigrellales bacterium]|jgi:hypothetical protein|nr:hypothetical protein [Silvanigrellales bacterium]